jgi:hypothetical protein
MKEFNNLFSRRGSKRKVTRTAATESLEGQPPQTESHVSVQVSIAFWVDLAAAAWKLRQKTSDPVTHGTREEFRHLTRYVDAIWDALASVGLEIQDHTNEPFDSGQSLEVLAFQPTAGITRETVTETIRPTIYLKGHRLQMGQVIVATPEQSKSAPAGE